MAQQSPPDLRYWLAPISPDLLVSIEVPGGPTIVEVSPQVAAWAGRTPQELVGRRLIDIFGPIMPALTPLVEEIPISGLPGRDYRVTCNDAAGIARTVRLQASLRPGKHPQKHPFIALRLEELPPRHNGAETLDGVEEFHGMLSCSPVLRKVFRKIELYGPTEAPVLITGETGTGKELAAHALHECSHRRHKPFIAVNCAALSEELLESELFGHERGAFTGAVRPHKGRFERAHGGTLFLDEIGDMPVRLQVKLLRVLEEGVLERVGAERELSIDVRVEAATNVPLEAAVQTRAFRADLYHRLVVLRLHMPPLREHPGDLPILVAHFLQRLNQKYQRHVRHVTPAALKLLAQYTWPGNVRELRNILERVYIETSSDSIGPEAFEEWLHERAQGLAGIWDAPARPAPTWPVLVSPYTGFPRALPPGNVVPPEALPAIDIEPTAFAYLDPHSQRFQEPMPHVSRGRDRELTRENLLQAYKHAAGNITEAARLLGVHRATLYRHMKTLGVTRDELDTQRDVSANISTTDHD